MKKVLLLLGVTVLVTIGCIGCAPKTIEDACAKADKKVDKHYYCVSSQYRESNGNKMYVVEIQQEKHLLERQDKLGMISFAMAHADDIYDEAKDCFENFPDVMICVAALDGDGHIYYLEIDGELQFDWYE